VTQKGALFGKAGSAPFASKKGGGRKFGQGFAGETHRREDPAIAPCAPELARSTAYGGAGSSFFQKNRLVICKRGKGH
jgi:hypothetical protein